MSRTFGGVQIALLDASPYVIFGVALCAPSTVVRLVAIRIRAVEASRAKIDPIVNSVCVCALACSHTSTS